MEYLNFSNVECMASFIYIYVISVRWCWQYVCDFLFYLHELLMYLFIYLILNDNATQISGDIDVARNALVQVTTRLKANFFEREGALSAYPSVLPYLPMSGDAMDGSKYGGRDNKPHGRGYSSYSGGYAGSNDAPSSDNYGSYGGSQVRFFAR